MSREQDEALEEYEDEALLLRVEALRNAVQFVSTAPSRDDEAEEVVATAKTFFKFLRSDVIE